MGQAFATGVSAHHAVPIQPKAGVPPGGGCRADCLGAAHPAAAASNDIVEVLIDQAALVRLDRPAAEIVVGNPSIADVSVQSGKLLVVTGKSFGETNLIVMDADGKVVASRRLIVQEPRTGFVTVYRGDARQTLNCSPNCTPPLVIGDTSNYFDDLSSEIKTKQRSARPRLKARSKATSTRRGGTTGGPAHAAIRSLRVPIARCAARSSLARYPGRSPAS